MRLTSHSRIGASADCLANDRSTQSTVMTPASPTFFQGRPSTSASNCVRLREHSDAPAFMDELRQADVPADLVKLVFDLENGASRKVSSGSQQVVLRGALRNGMVIANEGSLAEITLTSQVKVHEGSHAAAARTCWR